MTEPVTIGGATLYCGDCREVLEKLSDQSVNCCVTSPPYFGLRDYGVDAQIGLEQTPDEYAHQLVAVFREARRVLRDDGTLWLNLGDSYVSVGGAQAQGAAGEIATRRVAQVRDRKSVHGNVYRPPSVSGLNPKNLIGIPWRVAFALQADGWYLRSDIIWHKPNPMPESVRDRPTKSHEYVFMLSKSERYYFGQEDLKENANYPGDAGYLRGDFQLGSDDKISWRAKSQENRILSGVDSRKAGVEKRNTRSVWTIATKPFAQAHFATFPPELAERCIKGGCPAGGTVLDPFSGAGTTALVADRLQRHAIGIELNPEYHAMACERLRDDVGGLGEAIGGACRPPTQDRLL